MTLRPIHYTAEQSSPTDGVFGCGAHTGDDATLFAPSSLTLNLQPCQSCVIHVWSQLLVTASR